MTSPCRNRSGRSCVGRPPEGDQLIQVAHLQSTVKLRLLSNYSNVPISWTADPFVRDCIRLAAMAKCTPEWSLRSFRTELNELLRALHMQRDMGGEGRDSEKLFRLSSLPFVLPPIQNEIRSNVIFVPA